MKFLSKYLFLCFSVSLLLFCREVSAAEKGTFLLLQKTYFYETGKMEKRSLRTSTRKAYKVIGFIPDSKNKTIRLRIQVPSKKTKTSEGYVLKVELDDQKNKSEIYRVYSKIPKNLKQRADFITIPTANLISRTNRKNENQNSNLEWEKITYRMNIADDYWVYSYAGIYRPDLKAEQFNLLYRKVRKSGYGSSNFIRILSGEVNSGNSQKWVSLALGEPAEKVKKENGIEEWIYPAQKIQFKRRRVSLIVYSF